MSDAPDSLTLSPLTCHKCGRVSATDVMLHRQMEGGRWRLLPECVNVPDCNRRQEMNEMFGEKE